MPAIKIESNGVGTGRVWFDGEEIHDVCDIHMTMGVDTPVRVGVEVLASDRFEFTAKEGETFVGVRLLPGYSMRTKRLPDGSMKFWCVEEADPEDDSNDKTTH